MNLTKQQLIEMIEEVIERHVETLERLEEADGSGEDYEKRRARQVKLIKKLKPKDDLIYKGDDHDISDINKTIADKMKGKYSEPEE